METTGFYHRPVMLHEAVDGLGIKQEGVYVDATFGGGGHSGEILKRLGDDGRLIAFDQDSDAWKNKPADERLIDVHENFRYMKRFLKLHGYPEVDGILADLGVSSYQFDTGERGFSTRFDGPLDMRMDSRGELTAEELLKTYSEADLLRIFEQYGEVRNSRQLAKHIVDNRNKVALNSIASLKALLEQVMKGNPNKYLAQVFQALRIEVNDELGALKDLLEQSVQCLKQGGRLSIITFHSLEDRMVKQFMKRGVWGEVETDVFGRAVTEPKLKPLNNKPIEASEEETRENPRARSARLRIAERL
ncbi:MAG: 16S rRNA (cytosine(1402)-N(4))-methyltransferase RsmH [Chitinophagaceae bacterium]|nr:16S rRNA (cytosine(1402)-N(4))-methyltransferase RsmH [Chitinophagaceae bacterium]MCB9045298.1 16S rRNA (cytosine(1402)-N(4))-methyltransferase RsmH [Chitinophagales bacterium]